MENTENPASETAESRHMSRHTEGKFAPRLCRIPKRRNWYLRWTQDERSCVVSTGTENPVEAERFRDQFVANFNGRHPASKPRRSLFYAIQAGAGGPIKFGIAQNMDMRLADLQTGNHLELRVLLVRPNTTAFEAMARQWFAHHHIRGEWFRPGRDLMEWIKHGCNPRLPKRLSSSPPPTPE